MHVDDHVCAQLGTPVGTLAGPAHHFLSLSGAQVGWPRGNELERNIPRALGLVWHPAAGLWLGELAHVAASKAAFRSRRTEC